MEKIEANWTITEIDLRVSAYVPGISDSQLRKIAEIAKSNCPVSRLLNAKISLNAQLATESETPEAA